MVKSHSIQEIYDNSGILMNFIVAKSSLKIQRNSYKLFFIVIFAFVITGIKAEAPNINSPLGSSTIALKDFNFFYSWALHFQQKNPNCVIACIGKPTAPIYTPLLHAMKSYPLQLKPNESICYGDLQGELSYRKLIAAAFTRLYKTDFTAENILFTVGGKMGLQAIKHLVKKSCAGKKVVVTLPTYPDHKMVPDDDLIMVDTTSAPLTAQSLELALQDTNPESIGAFIFCSPNNPMGWTVSKQEWDIISQVLEKYPNSIIILDEAYAELTFGDSHASLVSQAPNLKNRIILLRSATKGLSASGARMAILACWNPLYMTELVDYHCTHTIHAPIDGQYAYAKAMESLKDSDLKKLAQYYEPQVRTVEKVIKKYNFHFSDRPISGTFYVVAKFNELIGKRMSAKAWPIYPQKKEFIESDIDVAFHLLAEYGIAFMPMSLMGIDPQAGLLRITCSMNSKEFKQLTAQLEKIRSDLDLIS